MAIIILGQKGYVLILPILTLCCSVTAFYRLPYPTAFTYRTRIVFYEILNSEKKNLSLRMSERSEAVKRAEQANE
jgi:predicted permease